MFDRSDHVAAVRNRQHEQARELMPLVRLVASAAPVMAGLTQDDSWNRYLGYLQGLSGTWEKARDSARLKLASPSVWSHEELLKLKCDVLVADATIEAFRFAMELPKAIMAGHGEAERLIKVFSHEEEENESA